MSDFTSQRTVMVDSQVRPSDVTDRRIPRAMLDVPREVFAPGARKGIAYADGHLPLTGDRDARRVLLAPRTLAKMIQALDVGENDAVLDLGCGTGYSTALLARLSRVVTAVEVDPVLAGQARSALATVGASTATVNEGLLEVGAPATGPYDAILLNGAVMDMPAALLDQMKDAGRLVAILIEGGVGRATLWRRFGATFDHRPLFDAEAPLLPGFARQAAFVL